MSILDTIKPIKLLRGSHSDTGVTGSGCMMNVISYLQGDSVITDDPDGVDPIIRLVCIRINDLMFDAERQRLHELIFRAMKSETQERRIIERRERIMNRVVKDLIEMVLKWGADNRDQKVGGFYTPAAAPAYVLCCDAIEWALRYAIVLPPCRTYDKPKLVMEPFASVSCPDHMITCQYHDERSRRAEVIGLCITMLDDLLPDTEVVETVHEERAIVLVETARSKGTLVTA